MAKKKPEKRQVTFFTPEELATISVALYGHGIELIDALRQEGKDPEPFRERIMRLRAKVHSLMEETRESSQVIAADQKFDVILAQIVAWEANQFWKPETFIQIVKTPKGWEAEVCASTPIEEKTDGSDTNENTAV